MVDPDARPRVTIRYCPRCRWLARAAWYAQELLDTFGERLASVALAPSGSGVFQVEVDGERVFCRSEERGFVDAAELKRRVRDRVAPDLALGHSDRAQMSPDSE